MQVTFDDAPHPITDDGRRRRVIDVPDGATVQEIVEGELKSRAVDMEIILDGREVVVDANVPPPEGAVITVRPRLRGGLGRIIGTLAVIAAAIFIPPLLGLQAGTLAAALASAAITVIGGLVVNALFPPELPDIGRVEGVSNPNPAQLFNLSGGSNRARRYEPLPLVLGEHRVFPDQAAVEYTENEGDEQYLNAIYNFGLGDLDVSDLRIGPTPLTDFADVSTQWSDAAGKITLVAGNVDTTAGAALTDTNWVSRTTGAGSIRAQVDFGGRIFKVNDRGKHLSHTVAVEVRFSKSDTAAVTRSYNLTHGDSGTYRRTVKIALPEAGEWDIEVRRTTAPDASDRVYDEVTFSALRSYQPDDGNYRGQTRLAIRVRASGQLNGRLDRLSGLVKQKLPIVPVPGTAVWGAGKVATRNPAALFVALCRGFSIGGRPVAGVGLEDSRIDLAGLAAWYDWCHTREYKCDLVIQGPMTRDAALRLIARRGRATLSWKTGKLGVVYEDSAVEESTMITPANIIAGSFSVNWNSAPPSDEIVVRYIDPGMDWEWNSVRRNRPGLSGTPQSTTTITAKGVTDREQAAVIANLQAARQEYHPRRLAWEMSRPGRDINVGDVVWITHSLIDSGIAGRLKSASNDQAVLDRAPADVTGGHILLRLPDGELVTSEMTVAGDTVTLAAPPDDWPGDATRYHLPALSQRHAAGPRAHHRGGAGFGHALPLYRHRRDRGISHRRHLRPDGANPQRAAECPPGDLGGVFGSNHPGRRRRHDPIGGGAHGRGQLGGRRRPRRHRRRRIPHRRPLKRAGRPSRVVDYPARDGAVYPDHPRHRPFSRRPGVDRLVGLAGHYAAAGRRDRFLRHRAGRQCPGIQLHPAGNPTL